MLCIDRGAKLCFWMIIWRIFTELCIIYMRALMLTTTGVWLFEKLTGRHLSLVLNCFDPYFYLHSAQFTIVYFSLATWLYNSTSVHITIGGNSPGTSIADVFFSPNKLCGTCNFVWSENARSALWFLYWSLVTCESPGKRIECLIAELLPLFRSPRFHLEEDGTSNLTDEWALDGSQSGNKTGDAWHRRRGIMARNSIPSKTRGVCEDTVSDTCFPNSYLLFMLWPKGHLCDGHS